MKDKKVKRVDAQLNRLSEISSGIAQHSIASAVIPFIIDKFDMRMVILGLITATVFYTLSVLFAR